MRILVDTSVWSEALRRKDKTRKSEDTFIFKLISREENIVLTGIVLQEVLSGIISQKLFNEIKEILKEFNFIEATKENYIAAAELKNILKLKGIAVSTIDALIASIAINNNLYLATYDKDFTFISKHCNLKTIDENEYEKIITDKF